VSRVDRLPATRSTHPSTRHDTSLTTPVRAITGSLHHFIRSCLAPTPTPSAGAATLVLFTTPPRLNLADDATTLAAAGLAPAALVHCALDGCAGHTLDRKRECERKGVGGNNPR
jgi:hypothetical protein